MGRLRANFARLGNPMQDCHLRKEPALRDCLPALRVILAAGEESRYVPLMRHSVVNTSRREVCSKLTFESYVMNNIPMNQPPAAATPYPASRDSHPIQGGE